MSVERSVTKGQSSRLVRILHSAEEDNLSPFDSNIVCLCQNIEINNNTHVCMYVWCMYACMHNFSSIKRTCWTAGSWRSCLSLEVVSSIPAGSTILYRFPCGFICVSLCQSIKIKPTNMYVCMLEIRFQRPWFKSCIQQRKTTCLLSWKSLACARA